MAAMQLVPTSFRSLSSICITPFDASPLEFFI
jgi:hypothetical protein